MTLIGYFRKLVFTCIKLQDFGTQNLKNKSQNRCSRGQSPPPVCMCLIRRLNPKFADSNGQLPKTNGQLAPWKPVPSAYEHVCEKVNEICSTNAP